MKCESCGFNMVAVFGAEFKIDPELERESPRHIAKPYKICWSCMLEAFGIQPNRQTDEEEISSLIETTKEDTQ